MRQFFMFCLVFWNFQVFGQEIFDKKFQASQLQEDFKILVSALEEAHPNLFLYQDEEDWKEKITIIEQNLEEPLSEAEFYNLLKPLIAQIRDGNTALILSEYGDMTMKEYVKFFPMDCYFEDGKAYILYDYSEANLNKGTEILEINELKINDLLKKMIERNSADAYIKTSSYWRLEQDLFSQELALLLGSQTTFRIRYKTKDNEKIQSTEINAISFRKKTELQQQNPPIVNIEKPFELRFYDSVAYLRYDILGDYFDTPEKFIKFTKKSFEEIQQKDIQKLILDVRNNGAGEDLHGKILYSYLSDSLFYYYKSQNITQEKYSFVKYTDDKTLNRTIGTLRKNLRENGMFEVSLDGLDKVQRPEREAFKGKLIVLVNGGTFGTAKDVAALVKYNKRGQIIGQETGGTAEGGTSGIMPYLILPNTALQLALPLVKYEMAISVEQKGRGVMPDIEIRDKILEKALEIMEKE